MGMTVKIRANTRTVYGGPESGAAEFSVTGSATAFSTRLGPGVAGFVVTGSAYAERTGDAATAGTGTLTVTGSAATTVVHQVLTAEGAATVTIAIAGFAESDAITGSATMSFTGAAAVNVTRTQAAAGTLTVTGSGSVLLGTEGYMSFITGLSSATTYHVRAYATNTTGTGYGTEVDFAAAGGTNALSGAAGFAITSYMGASSPLYNVMDYGAHANGTTTDVDHIEAAITAASATGGTVYLPTGTYYLATTLTLPSGSKLLGDGVALTWLKGTVTYDGSSTLTGICAGPGGLYNVETYGATHAGTHNDAPHILQAVLQCAMDGGGTVYLPAGTYYISTGFALPGGYYDGAIVHPFGADPAYDISIGALAISTNWGQDNATFQASLPTFSHVYLQGAGVGQTILDVHNQSFQSSLGAKGQDHFGFSGLTVNMDRTVHAGDGDGIKMEETSYAIFSDIAIDGTYIVTGNYGCDNNTFTRITGTNAGFGMVAGDGSQNVLFDSCEMSGMTSSGYGFGFIARESSGYITYRDCNAHNNANGGFYSNTVESVTHETCQSDDNSGYGFYAVNSHYYLYTGCTASGNSASNAIPYNGGGNTPRP